MEYFFLFSGLSFFCTASVIIIKFAQRTFKARIMATEEFYNPSLVTIPVDMTACVSASVDACTSLCTREVEEDEVCAVCLDHLNLSANLSANSSSDDSADSSSDREVRELMHNCRHVFHRGCLDAWMASGHGMCPVCRAKLMAADRVEEGFRPGAYWDPWRLERMIYLFGGDEMF